MRSSRCLFIPPSHKTPGLPGDECEKSLRRDVTKWQALLTKLGGIILDIRKQMSRILYRCPGLAQGVSIFFLVLVLGVLGCENKGFKAERRMWRAHKLAQSVYKNPKGTPPFQLNYAQDAYREIIRDYPGSIFAVQSQFSIGHLFLVKGEFQKARNEYKKLTGDCEKKGNLCAEAYFSIGRSYELENRWDEAFLQYRTIMDDFEFSSKSLDLPIYIIRHYRFVPGNEKSLECAVEEAASYYLKLKRKTQTQKGGYLLQTLIARSYIEGGQWQNALDSLEKLARDYPENSPEGAIWLKVLIYANNLKDKANAKEEITRILKEYPQSKLAKPLQALLKKL